MDRLIAAANPRLQSRGIWGRNMPRSPWFLHISALQRDATAGSSCSRRQSGSTNRWLYIAKNCKQDRINWTRQVNELNGIELDCTINYLTCTTKSGRASQAPCGAAAPPRGSSHTPRGIQRGAARNLTLATGPPRRVIGRQR